MELFKLDTAKQRISQASKNKNDKQWYKNQSDLLDHNPLPTVLMQVLVEYLSTEERK